MDTPRGSACAMPLSRYPKKMHDETVTHRPDARPTGGYRPPATPPVMSASRDPERGATTLLELSLTILHGSVLPVVSAVVSAVVRLISCHHHDTSWR